MAPLEQLFWKSLERLASDAREQERYLVHLGVAPLADELALEFGDAFDSMAVHLDRPTLTAATRLDDFLDQISGADHAALWTIEALSSAEEWREIRALARAVLDAPSRAHP